MEPETAWWLPQAGDGKNRERLVKRYKLSVIKWISSGELLSPSREAVAQGERVLAVGVLWFVFQSFRRLSCV